MGQFLMSFLVNNKKAKGRRRLRIGLSCLLLISSIFVTSVNAFVVFSQIQQAETEYIYDYDVHLGIRTGGSEFGGQERTSDLKISSILTVSPVWSSKGVVLSQFKLSKTKIKFSQNGEKSKLEVKDLKKEIPHSEFYVEFVECQPAAILCNEDQSDLSTDFMRGVTSLFQFKSQAWKGTEVDIDGNCTVQYTVDHRGVHKVKSGCDTDPKESGMEGTSTDKSQEGLYHLQTLEYGFQCPEMTEVIEKVDMTQRLHHFVNLLPRLGSVVTTKQTLTLKEQLDSSGKLGDFKDVKELEDSLKKKFKLEKKTLIGKSSQPIESTKDVTAAKLRNLFKQNKKNLKPSSLATIESAVSFKKLQRALSRSKKLTKSDLTAFLKDNIKDHGLEIMDVFGSSKNIQCHLVGLETFGKLGMIDLTERYLWSLSQLQDCPHEVAEKLLTIAKDGVEDKKLKETLMLTIGSVSRHTSPGMSSKILQWLVINLTECKNEECVVIFIKAMRNTQSGSMAPVLLELTKADDNKVIAVEAMKALYSLPLKDSEKAVGLAKFVAEMMNLFTNKKKDSSIRGMAAEMVAKRKVSNKDMKIILQQLGQEKKEFHTFILKRLIDLSKYSPHLRKVLKKMVKTHILNWNLLATGGVSESFSRVLAHSDAGNFSFSFDLEIAGIMLKRSHTELFLSTPKCGHTGCSKLDIFQLDTFGGGMQQYLGTEGLDEDEIDKREPHAGMQITANNNLMRPFIFFTSSSELMSLYWSGAAEEKTSAFQANIMVQDIDEVMLTSSGLPVLYQSSGAISFDSSGSATISIWSKEAETKVENSGAYHLDYKCSLMASINLSHRELFEGKGVLEVNSALNWNKDNHMCIKVQLPPTNFKHKRIQSGKNSVTRVVKHQGKTVFLTHAINKLCNEMSKAH